MATASEEQVALQMKNDQKASPKHEKEGSPDEKAPLNSHSNNHVTTLGGTNQKQANGAVEITEDGEIPTETEVSTKRKPVWYKRKCMIVGLALFILIICGAIIGLVIHRFTVGDGIDNEPSFMFASYYGDHMVLQRSPRRASVWGYADNTKVGKTVQITLEGSNYHKKYSAEIKRAGSRPTWHVQMDPVEKKGPYSLSATLEGRSIKLTDILFGDVWLCSGESNMRYDLLSMIKNGTEELKAATRYREVRVFTAGVGASTMEQEDLKKVTLRWNLPSRNSLEGYGSDSHFSGLCWLYGKRLNEELGYPVGLVSAAASTSLIEYWMPQEISKVCRTNLSNTETRYKFVTPGGHWNAMIHPLTSLSIYGILWYQGESDALHLSREYNCTFPTMVHHWKREFKKTSGHTVPFGFVQLSANREGHFLSYGFTDIRWQQTADFGFVPNPELQDAFMAVAVDLPDPESPRIHPRNKHEIARRLLRGALAVAYKQENYRFQGPLPATYIASRKDKTLEITYDTPFITVMNKTGFELCCTNSSTAYCYSSNRKLQGLEWVPSKIISHDTNSIIISWNQCSKSHITALRYLWRETPCAYKMCAVYDRDTQLPAPPYIYYGLKSNAKQQQKFTHKEVRLI